MPGNFDTSFMPQQPLLKVEGVIKRSEPVNFALVLGLIIFVTSIVVAAGTYFYKVSIDKDVLGKAQQLEAAEKDLAIDDIELYKRIDSRLAVANNLLDNHKVFSVILDLLESSAAQNIGLTSLGYTKDGKNYRLALTGQATSYGAVYFQVEAWRNVVPLVKSVDVTSITLEEETGIVTFGATLLVNGDATSYSRLLEAERQILEGKGQTAQPAAEEEVNTSTP